MEKGIDKIVAYYRVSTRKQGESGLGLDAQRKAVLDLARQHGAKVIAEFTEVESGKRSDRVEIAKAIARTRALRGTLVIANITRLARNVAFTATLRESGVAFICCDNPHADDFTINILASVAEKEAKDISDRTKAALAAAKRRGVKLGTHRRGHRINWRKGMRNGLAKATARAAAKAAKLRDDCYGYLLPDMRAWRAAGASYAAIAERLNEGGHVTTNGKAFAAMTVQRILG
jgi:DNA invertase Pin-like site-specific DNA recombinase